MKNKFKSKADDRRKLKELVTRQLPRREREATEHTPSRGQTKPDNHTDLPKAHHNWKWKALVVGYSYSYFNLLNIPL